MCMYVYECVFGSFLYLGGGIVCGGLAGGGSGFFLFFLVCVFHVHTHVPMDDLWMIII